MRWSRTWSRHKVRLRFPYNMFLFEYSIWPLDRRRLRNLGRCYWRSRPEAPDPSRSLPRFSFHLTNFIKFIFEPIFSTKDIRKRGWILKKIFIFTPSSWTKTPPLYEKMNSEKSGFYVKYSNSIYDIWKSIKTCSSFFTTILNQPQIRFYALLMIV